MQPMNELILSVIQKKMEKLQRKLERYATVFFGKDMRIMYISGKQIDDAVEKHEGENRG